MSLFLAEVKLTDSNPHAGGFSDVHAGKYKLRNVALKVLRVFGSMTEASQDALKQVGDVLAKFPVRDVCVLTRILETRLRGPSLA